MEPSCSKLALIISMGDAILKKYNPQALPLKIS